MNIAQMQVGTKLNYWHEVYEGENAQSTLVFAEVIKVGKKKIKVRDEFGNEAWKYPHWFNKIVSEATYQEIMAEKKQ